MNYRELCKSLLDYLYKAMADWLIGLEDAECSLVDNENHKERELINNLQYQGQIWVERLDDIRCSLDNNKTQSEEQESRLLCSKLYCIISEISSLEIIKDDQVEQDNQCYQALEDLKIQVEHEDKKVQSLRKLTSLNYEELSRLRKEIREKEDERDRLASEIEKINNQLKKQKKDIEEEGEYSKKLDEEILNVKDVLKKLKTKTDLMQQQLKEQNIEKEEYLAELKQEEENERNRLKALENQVAMQYESDISEIESDSDNEVKELTIIQSKVISQSNSIDQLASTLKSLQYELQHDILQDENSYWKDDMQCLQDNTISSTTQEMSDKEVQTLNTQRSRDRGMKYTVFFTIPFALTGVSLTVIPLIKSTENDTVFLSVGLSFSTLAIVCLVAVTLYSYYRESVADLELPKKLSGNSIDNIITQDYSMDKI